MHTRSKKEEIQAVTQRAPKRSARGQGQDLSLHLALKRVSKSMIVNPEATTGTKVPLQGKSSMSLLLKNLLQSKVSHKETITGLK